MFRKYIKTLKSFSNIIPLTVRDSVGKRKGLPILAMFPLSESRTCHIWKALSIHRKVKSKVDLLQGTESFGIMKIDFSSSVCFLTHISQRFPRLANRLFDQKLKMKFKLAKNGKACQIRQGSYGKTFPNTTRLENSIPLPILASFAKTSKVISATALVNFL